MCVFRALPGVFKSEEQPPGCTDSPSGSLSVYVELEEEATQCSHQ